MKPVTVQAEYRSGRVHVLEPERLAAWKSRLEEGSQLAMTFELWEDARTRRQQRLLHELLGRYARAMNDNLGRVKMEFKVGLGHWLPAEKLLTRAVDFPAWKGEWVDLHNVNPFFHAEGTYAFVRSESTYTKRMEGELIDAVLAACAENGVYVDDILETLDMEGRHRQDVSK